MPKFPKKYSDHGPIAIVIKLQLIVADTMLVFGFQTACLSL